MRCLVVGVLVAGACGASHEAAPGDGAKPIDGDAPGATGSDAGTADAAWNWQPLISNTWSMAAGQSGITCEIMPITQEMWIDGFRPAAAMDPANDHQFVIVTPDSGCLADRPLNREDELIYAAGLGDAQLAFPTGIAVHVTPMNALNQNLNLVLYDHISNEGSTLASGTSSIEVHTVADPTTVVHEVDMVLGGNGATWSVPANDQPTSLLGKCFPSTTAGYQWHVVAVWPHMHESGTHVNVSILGGATVYDAAYDYQHEGTYLVPDTLVDTGAELDVSCMLANANPLALMYDELEPEPDGKTVCWTGLYKYPTGTDPNTAMGTAYGPEACVAGSPSQYTR